MEKYLIGSCLLGLRDPKDADYVVLTEGDNADSCVHKYENGEDCFYKTKANLDSYMNFERKFTHETVPTYIVSYQYDAEIIGQDFPVKYNVSAQRSKYVELLKWIVANKALNFDKSVLACINDGTKLTKNLYHVAYLLFILQNNTVALTNKQKQTVQQIHDGAMPVDYLDELERAIYALK